MAQSGRGWSYGVIAQGSNFAPNASITAIATDPTGKLWREFTGTSNAQGAFFVRMSGKTFTSPVGDYVITTKDNTGNIATGILKVVPNSNEIYDAQINRMN